MKIRYGFVSNSSSQSFVIYGIHTNNEREVQKILNMTDDELKDAMDSFDFDGHGFDVTYDGINGYWYIGKSIRNGCEFYCVEEFVPEDFVEAAKAPEVKKLEEWNYKPKILIGMTESG